MREKGGLSVVHETAVARYGGCRLVKDAPQVEVAPCDPCTWRLALLSLEKLSLDLVCVQLHRCFCCSLL